MVAARVINVLEPSDGKRRVNKVWVRFDERVPFEVFLNRDGTSAKQFDSIVCIVTFASEDTCNGVESLLNLSNNDGFELASRVLEVEVCLLR